MNWKAFLQTLLTTVITAGVTALLQYVGVHPVITAGTAGVAAGVAHTVQSPYNI